MRLWSIHPEYLDPKGLVALWREGLLALAVLEGRIKGYINHPQILRFKKTTDPVNSIKNYLKHVLEESMVRGYKFNQMKLKNIKKSSLMPVTEGQLRYEINHLKKKLKERNLERYRMIKGIVDPKLHPSFRKVQGRIAEWENRKQ